MSLGYPEFGWRQSSGNRLKGVGCFWMNHVFNHQTLPIRTAADFPQIFFSFFCVFHLKSDNFNFRLAALD